MKAIRTLTILILVLLFSNNFAQTELAGEIFGR